MVENLLSTVSGSNLFEFIGYALLFIILGSVAKGSAKFVSVQNPSLKERFIPALSSIVNWITSYSIILLFLFLFSKKKWLFYPLYTQGGVKVTLFLIIIAIMVVSLASSLVKLLTRYVLTPIYSHYDVDKGLGFTFN
jgi:hypothetical protein